MAQQSAKAKSGQLRDSRHQSIGIGAIGIDAAAVKSHVDLDEDVDRSSGSTQARGPLPRDRRIVDDEREPGAIEQREHAIGVDGVERIGEPDVLDAGVRKDLGLAELRAADADRAARDLASGHVRELVRLGVRPEANAARVRRGLHAVDVPRHARGIDEDGRSAKLGEFHPYSLVKHDTRHL